MTSQHDDWKTIKQEDLTLVTGGSMKGVSFKPVGEKGIVRQTVVANGRMQQHCVWETIASSQQGNIDTRQRSLPVAYSKHATLHKLENTCRNEKTR